MGKYNGAVLTTAGQQVISSAIAGSQTVQWTAIKTSSAVIPSGTNLEALTDLDDIEQSGDITSAQVYVETVIQVSGRVSNLNVSTAYLVQAIGIYGKLVGGQETLIAVSTAVTPDQVPVYDEDSPAAFIYNVQITVSNASQVTMTVNDAGTATVADLNLKIDKSAIVNDLTATDAGHVLDARQGKALDEKIDNLGLTGMHNPNLGYVYLSYDNIDDIVTFARSLVNGRTYSATFNVNTSRVLFGAEFVASGVVAKTNGSGIFRFLVSSATGGAINRAYSGALVLADKSLTLNTLVSETYLNANYAPIVKYGIAASASKEIEVVSSSYIRIDTFSADTSKMKSVHIMVDYGGIGHLREIGGGNNITITANGQWADSETHLTGAVVTVTNTAGHAVGVVITIYSGGLNG